MRRIDALRNLVLGVSTLTMSIGIGCEPTEISYEPSGGGDDTSSSFSSSGNVSTSTGMGGFGNTGGVGGVAGVGGVGGGTGGVGGALMECFPGKPADLAMDQMFLGDTDPNGTPNPTNGWKQFGFNLDNRFSTKTSTDLCQPLAGGSKAAVYPDGNEGIDNSFGKNILPIFLGLASDLSHTNNESIRSGRYTYLLSIANADQEFCETSSSFLLGADMGQLPKFDGSDVWPVDIRSFFDPVDPLSAKCQYFMTRLEGGIVNAGPPSQFDLVLNLSGFEMVLPVRLSRMRYELSPDRTQIIGGQIGGIIDPEDMANQVAKVAAAFDTSFCDPNSPTLQSILNQIRQAADIMIDGTQDPARICNGISIGLGFTMRAVRIGSLAPPPVTPPDPCMP